MHADSLFFSLSHFEWDGHTVHMLTQQCLPSPLTSTVKSSLFMHAHSSSLSLAARLHWCQANHPHYINNGWTFLNRPCIPLIIYMFCKNFLPFCELLFYSVDTIIWCTNLKNFHEVKFVHYFLLLSVYWCHSQEIIAKPTLWNFCPYVFFWELYFKILY